MGKRSLTGKQQHFCRAVSSGLSLADAYREAYSAEGMSANAIRTEASRLMTGNPAVALMVKALNDKKNQAHSALGLTQREQISSKLVGWMNGIEASSSELRATELLAKINGMLKDNVEVTSINRDSSEVAGEIERKLGALLLASQEQLSDSANSEPSDPVH